ncbi:AMP-binding protein [Conexibacter sp. W3-3-2]|uniref:class I adenylate-forming enzyme family protein n=1 Tax=Conexibacter sp. W3-3-2 TaxID=2675227 RepID=UPI0012BA330D|nr:AMP-binding protein [Conexibacter sp. W3-3-2]MTD43366.1 AMP-binding protein [Conexibacter sp. W3-3-2]
MQIGCWVRRSARARPHVEALQGVPYAELDRLAGAAAGALAGRGVRRGDRVGLLLPPGPAFAAAFWGALRLGATAVPVSPKLAAPEVAHQTGSCVLVVDEPLPTRVLTAPDPLARDEHDAAVLLHTSGTTSTPKPVVLTLRNLLWAAQGSAAAIGHPADERWLSALPFNHVGGLSILVRSAIAGTTAEVHDGFDAERIAARLAAADGPTVISVVATTLSRLLDAGLREPPRLRAAVAGGGPIPPVLVERARAAGVPVAQTYGMTESTAMATIQRPGDPQPDAGPPLFCTRVTVADDGEILLAGPTVSRSAAGEDGVLRTGDLGRLDGDGRLTVVGRTADTIISGGENVAPAEVEAALERHPAVLEAAVLGRPDPEWGEAVVAVVVPRPGTDPSAAELREHCGSLLAGHKVPKTVELRPTPLPRTASGKLLRRALD